MRLLIVDDEGVVHEVTDELEGYDLRKPAARADLMDDIRDTVDVLKERKS